MVLAAPSARTGDRLSVVELVKRSEAAVTLEIRNRPGKGPTLAIRKVFWGLPPQTSPGASWLNHCVPSRTELRRWLAANPKWAEAKLWQRALVVPRFEAVIFLRTIGGKLKPSCETEVMLMKHTSLHPEHAGYIAALETALAKRVP